MTKAKLLEITIDLLQTMMIVLPEMPKEKALETVTELSKLRAVPRPKDFKAKLSKAVANRDQSEAERIVKRWHAQLNKQRSEEMRKGKANG